MCRFKVGDKVILNNKGKHCVDERLSEHDLFNMWGVLTVTELLGNKCIVDDGYGIELVVSDEWLNHTVEVDDCYIEAHESIAEGEFLEKGLACFDKEGWKQI